MNIISKFCFAIVLLAATFWGKARAQEVTFATDDWCPYICNVNSDKPGILVESIRHIFSGTNYQPKFVNINWARSIKEVRSGKIDGLLGTYTSDAPDFIYGESHFMMSEMCFFITKDDDWEFQNVLSLNSRRIIFMNGYSYGSLFDNYILNNENVGERNLVRMNGVEAADRRISLMEKRWADTLIEDRLVFKHLVVNEGKVGDYRDAGCLAAEQVHVGFSPSNSNSVNYTKIVSDGIRQMKLTGELDKITQRYVTASR